ncbi:hypothetical protein GE09DRAFT_391337 [Coniochaeta sp. 2T2.1]|nr:hypothetical protein GE09DRAFT_391337 [Coniochaeta sp. 2T2.1]
MPPLHHFILRPSVLQHLPTGEAVTVHPQSLVPLIPIDELPEWLDIPHLPRELTAEQTGGLVNLGCYERRGVWEVEIIVEDDVSASSVVGEDGDGANDRGGTDDVQRAIDAITVKAGAESEEKGGAGDQHEHPNAAHGTAAGLSGTTTTEPGLQSSRWADRSSNSGSPSRAASAPCTVNPRLADMHPADRMMAHVSPGQVAHRHAVHHHASSHHPQIPGTNPGYLPSATSSSSKAKSSTPTATAPGSDTTTSTKKRRNYCRHWVHHGTCKWGLHCRFEHRMPVTPEGLAEIGLRDLPAWWAAMMAGSPLPVAGRKGYRGLGSVRAMGYPYGLPGGFIPGYGPGPGAAGFGVGGDAGAGAGGGYGGMGGLGGLVGYTRKERQRLVKEMERGREREIHPQEKDVLGKGGRKVRVEPGLVVDGTTVGLPALRTMAGEKVAVTQGQPGALGADQGPGLAAERTHAQTPAIVRGDVAVCRSVVAVDEKRDASLEAVMQKEAAQQQQQQQVVPLVVSQPAAQLVVPQAVPQSVVPQQQEQEQEQEQKLVDV